MTSPITDLTNIQGDILLNGLPKEVEAFWFFTIPDGQAASFSSNLRKVAQQEITSTDNVQSTRKNIRDFKASLAPNAPAEKLPTVGANISFTFNGLKKISKVVSGLNIQDNITGESSFEKGMRNGAVSGLQDPPKQGSSDPDWDAVWLNNQLDGVLLVAGNTPELVQDKLDRIKKLFGTSAKLAFRIDGKVRPGAQKGNEHFGYKDGISQPVVGGLPGLTKEETFVPPGQDTIQQGTILCGRPGDFSAQNRPAWMVDGSFLVFRKLKQNVQDWNKFLVDSSNTLGTWSDQLGARLIGRWKSGCPVNLSPDFDDKAIGNDPMRNNQFEFDPPGLNQSNFEIKAGMRMVCPIGAHIRKTNPRGDQPPSGRPSVNSHRILRRGIPYGPEISEDPNAERGLLFACYQSSLNSGFDFIQQAWANNPFFRFQGGGIDAVMGQTNDSPTVGMKGLFPQDANRELQLSGVNRFVVPKGGEYFFSPSIGALTGVLSNVVAPASGGGQAPLGH
ncbi:hypothetical protein PRZ48_015081 [Zasmidium cellare]|uniref:Dyp-type peroxidase n=1 Tax=Zasmidium cellare TaxID=395010 RepID=A0ABR0DY04_ZASCE|nr:hypothetical protein PRZ48_015081 [Zasmidium cellare]